MRLSMFKKGLKRATLLDNRGAAAVEFAIIFPLLILLIVLLIDFGRLFFVQISLNAASREAARWSSLSVAPLDVANRTNASSPGVAVMSSLSASQLVVTSVTTCTPTLTNESTEVTVAINFKWITPGGLVKIFSPNSTLANSGGMQLQSKGQMLCSAF
ncbi:MAG: hypothetical protein RI895_103 [Actinomycetota bacterium]